MVYKGKWRGVHCAIKQLNTPIIDLKAKMEFRKEAAIMQYDSFTVRTQYRVNLLNTKLLSLSLCFFSYQGNSAITQTSYVTFCFFLKKIKNLSV